MRTLDIIALALFMLWIFGVIHILLGIVIVAVLQGVARRRKTFRAKKLSVGHNLLRVQ